IISFTSPTNWCSRDKLSLYASGDGGILELQKQLHGDVFFVFLREDRSFILISFVPEDISGVRRARALVHSRAVGSLFKAHHAAWTVTKPESLTVDAIRSKLKLPYDGSRSTPSSPASLSPNENGSGHSHRLASPVLDQEHPLPPVPTPGTTTSSPSNSPQRKRTQTITSTPSPPPEGRAPGMPDYRTNKEYSSSVSPESVGRKKSTTDSPSLTSRVASSIPVPVRSNNGRYPGSSTSVNGDTLSKTQGSVSPNHLRSTSPARPQASFLLPPEIPSSPRTAAQEQAALSRAKWAAESETERRVLARQRSQMELQREAEAEQQAIYDAARSARLKLEREEAMRLEMDADDRRKLVEQEHARRQAAERVAEEQRRRDELSQKKAMEAQRRREEVAARIRREKEAELEREREAEARRREEEQRVASKRAIQQQFSSLRTSGAIMLTGKSPLEYFPFPPWIPTSSLISRQCYDSGRQFDVLATTLF
ncbi:hypothetical protein BS47DRAFT_1350734, partial [Hydnum rufescens UP504]